MSWEMVKMDDLCKMNSGGTPSRSNLSFYDGDIPWAKISDIENAEGGIIRFTEEHITKEGLASINNRIFDKGTLLLAMYGSVGKVAFAGMEMTTNQAILGIKIKDESRVSYSYLKYWFQTIKEQLLNRAVGGTLQNISLGIVKDLQIPLPPLPIQKRIDEILDAADALRRKDQALLQKYDELAQAIFIDMFGDPVKNEKGWEVKTMNEVALKVTDGDHLTPIRSENGYKLLSCRNVKNGFIDFDAGLDFVGEQEFQRMYKRCNPERGDILISCSGTIGRVTQIKIDEKFVLVRSAALIKLNRELINPTFLEYYLQTDFMQREMIKNANTSSQANLFTGPIKSLPVLIPDQSLQLNFAEKISILEQSRLMALSNKINQNSLFQTLLQKAFKGELVE